MPSYAKPAPKHRAAKHRALTPRRAPKVALKTTLTLSSMAVLATGLAVGTGSVSLSALGGTADTTDLTSVAAPVTTSSPDAPAASDDAPAAGGDAATAPATARKQAAAAASRDDVVTRSDARDATTSNLKADTLSLGQGNTVARSEDLSDQAPQVIAQALLSQFGWSQDQFSCLDSLWTRESGWNIHADNPTSSAYGIPQALPGSKMASAGSDWMNNAVTQITWGLGYIQDRYGSPCAAWAHSESSGFY